MKEPGPNCKSNVRCYVCRMKTHRKGSKNHGKWIGACSTCSVESVETFSNRNDAIRWFRRHKHDDYSTYREPFKTALTNLQDAKLI